MGQTSTIAQFHVMDYGMENCSITFTVPNRGTTDTSPILKQDGTDSTSPVQLDVWALSLNKKLRWREISWSSKPPRTRHLGVLSLSYGTTQQLPGFSCLSTTYQTFELSCVAGTRCHVDVYAPRQNARGQSHNSLHQFEL